jgi:hypothetical protein
MAVSEGEQGREKKSFGVENGTTLERRGNAGRSRDLRRSLNNSASCRARWTHVTLCDRKPANQSSVEVHIKVRTVG